jgi:DNA-binding response OmpR family regulator
VTTLHILFADDDGDTRAMVNAFLQHEGFRVSLASSSQEVLNKTGGEDHFDAFVLDKLDA